jgi:cyclin D1/2/4, plant
MALTPDLSASSSLLCGEDAGDIASWTDGRSAAPASSATTSAPTSDSWDLPFSDSSNQFLSTLLASEPDFMPHPDYLSRLQDQSLDATSRQDAVNWILKVNSLFRFRPVTAYLSVSYLDRFLSTRSLPVSKGAINF